MSPSPYDTKAFELLQQSMTMKDAHAIVALLMTKWPLFRIFEQWAVRELKIQEARLED